MHLIRTRLKARGIPLSWDSIRTRLRPWVRVTTTIRETNGRLIVNRQDVRPPAMVAQIARATGVEPHHYRRAHPPKAGQKRTNVVPVCWHPVL